MVTRALLNAALWALVFAGTSARGDVFTHPWEQQLHQTDCDQIVTYNPTKKWIWVTIYDLGKTQHLGSEMHATGIINALEQPRGRQLLQMM